MKRPSQQDSSKKTAYLWDAPDFFIEVATTTFLLRPLAQTTPSSSAWGPTLVTRGGGLVPPTVGTNNAGVSNGAAV